MVFGVLIMVYRQGSREPGTVDQLTLPLMCSVLCNINFSYKAG